MHPFDSVCQTILMTNIETLEVNFGKISLTAPFRRFIDYCMRRVDLLRQHGVKPLLVFDGGRLPMKENQENKRARYAF